MAGEPQKASPPPLDYNASHKDTARSILDQWQSGCLSAKYHGHSTRHCMHLADLLIRAERERLEILGLSSAPMKDAQSPKPIDQQVRNQVPGTSKDGTQDLIGMLVLAQGLMLGWLLRHNAYNLLVRLYTSLLL